LTRCITETFAQQLEEIIIHVFDYMQSQNVFIFCVFAYTHSQNAHTTSSIAEHQVAVICEGKHWNVMG
jgi:hypothetical protein